MNQLDVTNSWVILDNMWTTSVIMLVGSIGVQICTLGSWSWQAAITSSHSTLLPRYPMHITTHSSWNSQYRQSSTIMVLVYPCLHILCLLKNIEHVLFRCVILLDFSELCEKRINISKGKCMSHLLLSQKMRIDKCMEKNYFPPVYQEQSCLI